MIDTETYQFLHPKQQLLQLHSDDIDVIDPETISADVEDPPDDMFFLLLPSTILGYAFHDKRWSK